MACNWGQVEEVVEIEADRTQMNKAEAASRKKRCFPAEISLSGFAGILYAYTDVRSAKPRCALTVGVTVIKRLSVQS